MDKNQKLLLVGGGIVLVGVAYWYFSKKKSPSYSTQSKGLPMGGSMGDLPPGTGQYASPRSVPDTQMVPPSSQAPQRDFSSRTMMYSPVLSAARQAAAASSQPQPQPQPQVGGSYSFGPAGSISWGADAHVSVDPNDMAIVSSGDAMISIKGPFNVDLGTYQLKDGYRYSFADLIGAMSS